MSSCHYAIDHCHWKCVVFMWFPQMVFNRFKSNATSCTCITTVRWQFCCCLFLWSNWERWNSHSPTTEHMEWKMGKRGKSKHCTQRNVVASWAWSERKKKRRASWNGCIRSIRGRQCRTWPKKKLTKKLIHRCFTQHKLHAQEANKSNTLRRFAFISMIFPLSLSVMHTITWHGLPMQCERTVCTQKGEQTVQHNGKQPFAVCALCECECVFLAV